MITPFRRVRSSDDVVRQLQDAVQATLQDVTGKAILDGQLIKDIILTTGTVKTINHKLERNLVGYIVVMQDAQSDVWMSPSRFPSLNLLLNCSADVTISLWVF